METGHRPARPRHSNRAGLGGGLLGNIGCFDSRYIEAVSLFFFLSDQFVERFIDEISPAGITVV
jgi:hypothetical protein